MVSRIISKYPNTPPIASGRNKGIRKTSPLAQFTKNTVCTA